MSELDKVNKQIIDLLTSIHPDLVELSYLYELRKRLS